MLFIGPPTINITAARVTTSKRPFILEIAMGLVHVIVSVSVGLVACNVIIVAALAAIGAGVLEIVYFFHLCKR